MEARASGLPELTPLEQKHTEFMKSVASELVNTPAVLKGGTALMLGYGLNRFSEDLDFDNTKALNLDKKIRDAAAKSGIQIESIKLKKDTETTKRYIVSYESELGAGRLKIETSLRAKDIAENQTTTINGIKTYKVENIVAQKLDALEGRSKVRDLYDINFLADKFPDAFTKQQSEKLTALTQNPDLLVSRFQADHRGDNILKSKSLDSLVLESQYNAEKLQQRSKRLEASQDFRNMKETEFLKKHPQLAPEIAAIAAIEKKLSTSQLSDEQQQAALGRVRDNVAIAINEGQKADIKLSNSQKPTMTLDR
jgi:predicted nucleotidyltransferase component of viral defense system